MNQSAEKIKLEYMGVASSLVNQYVQLRKQYPHEALERYKNMCQKFMTLVELWGWIESQQKEKRHG